MRDVPANSLNPGSTMRLRSAAVGILSTLVLGACAASGPAPASPRALPADAAPPALEAITEAELRRDLFALASDDMRGREAGELDEMRASAWVAERAREAGLLPAGDDGTYFQFFPVRRVRTAAHSTVSLGGTALTLGRDVVVVAPVDARVDLPVVWVGEGREADLAGVDLPGKAAAAVISEPSVVPVAWISLWGRRATQAAIRERAAFLAQRGAAAVILVSDPIAETQFEVTGSAMLRGRYSLNDGTEQRPAGQPPVLWLRRAMLDAVRAPGLRLVADIHSESFVYPSANVVAVAPGADPALRGEHVLFSGHQDHDGARVPVGGDSIWNGADDNATVSVAMLAIARSFVRQPGRRGALRLARCGGAGAAGLALVRAPPHRPARVHCRGAERRHDRPQPSGQRGAAGRAPAAPQLVGPGGDGGACERGGVALHPGHLVGRSAAPGGLVLSQRPPAVRVRQHPVALLHHPAARGLPYAGGRGGPHRHRQAHPRHALDVRHRLARRPGRRPPAPGARLPPGAPVHVRSSDSEPPALTSWEGVAKPSLDPGRTVSS
jgi:hypothetical protein